MKYKSLYDFLSSQCKMKSVRVDNLIDYCNCSRSTMYRYMKGISPIPGKTRALICEALDMSEGEIHQFNILIQQTGFDESLLKSRAVLDEFMFSQNMEQPGGPGIPLVYYNKEKYFRSFEEVLGEVLDACGRPGARCEIRIINCVKPELLSSLSGFLGKICGSSLESQVEHLLTFESHNYLGNIQALLSLITLLPLATYKNYRVYYSAEDKLQYKGLFADTVLISAGSEGQWDCFWLSFSGDALSSCIRFTDPYMWMFLLDNYNKLKANYEYILLDSKGVDMFSEDLLGFTAKGDNYLLKPNNCYDKIPLSQYQSMKERRFEELAGCLSALSEIPLPPAMVVDHYIEYINARITSTHRVAHTDIYSKKGLLELALTGRISDQFDGMPSFSMEERKEIFQYIRDRDGDPKDSYTLYVTDKELLPNGFIIVVVKGGGILVEYNQEQFRNGQFHNILIENNSLVEVFVDYIDNHLVENHVMDRQGTHAFLDELIQMCNVGDG